MTTATTSEVGNSSECVMESQDFHILAHRLHGSTATDAEILAQVERVRQRCVAEFSSSPLYQARAAKDPEYWNTFYVGRAR